MALDISTEMLVVSWSGVISVLVKWPCQGDRSLQERREMVRSGWPCCAWQEGSVEVSTSTCTHRARAAGPRHSGQNRLGCQKSPISGEQSRTWRYKGAVQLPTQRFGDKTSNKSIAGEKDHKLQKQKCFPQKFAREISWQGDAELQLWTPTTSPASAGSQPESTS